MAQFAKPVTCRCSARRGRGLISFQGFVRVAERLYLCEAIDPLLDGSRADPARRANRPAGRRPSGFGSPLVIYDYLDSLSVFVAGRKPDGRKLDLAPQAGHRSEMVLATAPAAL